MSGDCLLATRTAGPRACFTHDVRRTPQDHPPRHSRGAGERRDGDLPPCAEGRSPAGKTAETDRFEKPAAYASAGIPIYWRVELAPGAPPVIFCYALDNGVYALTATADTTATITTPVTPDVTVTVDVTTLTPRRTR